MAHLRELRLGAAGESTINAMLYGLNEAEKKR